MQFLFYYHYMYYKSATKMKYMYNYGANIQHACYRTLVIQSEVSVYAEHFITILIFGQYLSFIQPLQLECMQN